MNKLLTIILIFVTVYCHATTYYVATTGNDSNNGLTTGTPFKNWEKLSSVMVAGDIAYIRGGIYTTPYTASRSIHCLWENMTGTITDSIFIYNYPGETPVFDFTGFVPTNTDPFAVYMENCHYMHIEGLRVTNLRQEASGVGVSWGWNITGGCSNILLKLITVDSIGGYGHKLSNSDNVWYLYCDVHSCADSLSTTSDPWDGSDGFGRTGGSNTATNTRYTSCRSWWNSDDGWDMYDTEGTAIIENCWAFWNGYKPGTFVAAGNGNGLKLGPANGNHATDTLRRLYQNFAFKNRANGFDQNDAQCLFVLYSNTSYDNGNYGYEWAYHASVIQNFKNNLGYANVTSNIHGSGSNVPSTYNSWNGVVTVSDADFISVSSTGMDGSRQADGRLPDLDFIKLITGSDLIGAGTNVGLGYTDMNWAPYVAPSTQGGTFIIKRKIIFNPN